MCVCVCGCAFGSQSRPIYLGGIVSETAPFLDAIIIHAGQGLRCEAPPYIKVSPIDQYRSAPLGGTSAGPSQHALNMGEESELGRNFLTLQEAINRGG